MKATANFNYHALWIKGGTTMIKPAFFIVTLYVVAACCSQEAVAQFPIRIPSVTKTEKPKTPPEATRTDTSATGGAVSSPIHSVPVLVFTVTFARDATPRLIKDSVYVQAETAKQYRKALGQKGFHSWAPKIREAGYRTIHFRCRSIITGRNGVLGGSA